MQEPWNGCGAQIMAWADELAQHSEAPGMLTRTYLTAAHHAAAAQLAEWMCAAGMSVRRDMAGNVIGRYEGLTADAPALVTGSHFDSVRNGGKYDGNLGILLPIACIGQWHAAGKRFPFALEVIGFAEEEGVRFKATLLGSRAAAGTFDLSVLDNLDDGGQSMRDVMAASGFHASGLGKAAYAPAAVLAFVEVHIEQGPVLLNNDLPLGVVSAISGASRFMVEIEGLAGHAGTVPMEMRRDAAMAAAEIGLYIEQRCSGTRGLVGTVGQFNVPNGAANVVPGKAIFSIDIRAEQDPIRQAAVADVLQHIELVAARRHVAVQIRKTHEAASVPCALWLQQQLAGAIEECALPLRHLPSGAGHDAMAMAAITDVAMLFVRCGNGGISHHPDEIMSAADAALGARVFSRFVENFKN
ncbi:allantoate amidohydrolase [Collimonas sp.]|jgi:allantoate deiminase|uniref:allantoate amidohydrolase n=1 Tax=Collimonas sp. TaxID=1963772 RepID=UPI002CE2546B|nr:allantoate amidohydrolase [Collimonas sp.]HWX01969.1 allantoate amidohydrolase [Collimonas sp.]